MNIGLSKSTYAFMIADPLAVLEENEIHMSFSGLFRDPNSRFDQTMLHDIDVLVARLPAHLPSDIQKVSRHFRNYTRFGGINVLNLILMSSRCVRFSSQNCAYIEMLSSSHRKVQSR